jgi:hypothetical protein
MAAKIAIENVKVRLVFLSKSRSDKTGICVEVSSGK